MSYYQDKTLCWKCSNYSSCCWARGKPVKGWVADKVVIHGSSGDVIRSYRVKNCPKFVRDKIVYTTCAEIAKIIGESEITTSHLLNRKRLEVEEILHKKGYLLRTFAGDKGWYLESIENFEHSNEFTA